MASIIASSSPDKDGYVTHVLDGPYEGWAYNSHARIHLDGQQTFQLHGGDSGDTQVTLDTPDDLKPVAADAPVAPAPAPVL